MRRHLVKAGTIFAGLSLGFWVGFYFLRPEYSPPRQNQSKSRDYPKPASRTAPKSNRPADLKNNNLNFGAQISVSSTPSTEAPVLPPKSKTWYAWEDPEARFRERLLRSQFTPEELGKMRQYIESQANPAGLFQIMAEANPGRDWLVTADYMSNVDNLAPDEHAAVLRQVAESWMKHEQPAVAIAWLKEHSGDPVFDEARAVIAGKLNPTDAQKFAAEIKNEELRRAVEADATGRPKLAP